MDPAASGSRINSSPLGSPSFDTDPNTFEQEQAVAGSTRSASSASSGSNAPTYLSESPRNYEGNDFAVNRANSSRGGVSRTTAEQGVQSVQETGDWESSNASGEPGSDENAAPSAAPVSDPLNPAEITDRQWLETVFGPGGALLHSFGEIDRRVSRIPVQFQREWTEVADMVIGIEQNIQRLVDDNERIAALPDLINLQNKLHGDRITRLERSTKHLVPLPGLLNELNDRHEALATSIAALTRECHTMAENCRVLATEHANMFNVVNQMYLRLSNHVGYVAPLNPSSPQIEANAAPNSAAPQPQVVQRPIEHEYMVILAVMVLVFAIAIMKGVEIMEIK